MTWKAYQDKVKYEQLFCIIQFIIEKSTGFTGLLVSIPVVGTLLIKILADIYQCASGFESSWIFDIDWNLDFDVLIDKKKWLIGLPSIYQVFLSSEDFSGWTSLLQFADSEYDHLLDRALLNAG